MGLLPVFMGLTEGMAANARARVVRDACLTAACVAVAFVFLGEWVFRMLSVTTDDFRMAGGLLLIVFAVEDLMLGGKPRRSQSPLMAVVPLGTPLIVGPGVLTTSLLLVQQHGYSWTLLALAANMAIVFVVLRASERILRLITPAGAEAAAKIASLLLATIGVMMLRLGLTATIKSLSA